MAGLRPQLDDVRRAGEARRLLRRELERRHGRIDPGPDVGQRRSPQGRRLRLVSHIGSAVTIECNGKGPLLSPSGARPSSPVGSGTAPISATKLLTCRVATRREMGHLPCCGDQTGNCRWAGPPLVSRLVVCARRIRAGRCRCDRVRAHKAGPDSACPIGRRAVGHRRGVAVPFCGANLGARDHRRAFERQHTGDAASHHERTRVAGSHLERTRVAGAHLERIRVAYCPRRRPPIDLHVTLPAGRVTVIGFGDSYVAGVGAGSTNDAFPEKAISQLGWKGQYFARAASGYCTSHPVDYLQRLKSLVAGKAPTVFLLEGGINDVGCDPTVLRDQITAAIGTGQDGVPAGGAHSVGTRRPQ